MILVILCLTQQHVPSAKHKNNHYSVDDIMTRNVFFQGNVKEYYIKVIGNSWKCSFVFHNLSLFDICHHKDERIE